MTNNPILLHISLAHGGEWLAADQSFLAAYHKLGGIFEYNIE